MWWAVGKRVRISETVWSPLPRSRPAQQTTWSIVKKSRRRSNDILMKETMVSPPHRFSRSAPMRKGRVVCALSDIVRGMKLPPRIMPGLERVIRVGGWCATGLRRLALSTAPSCFFQILHFPSFRLIRHATAFHISRPSAGTRF